MEPPEKALSQLQETLQVHFKELRFARAAELARCGRYLEAEGLLSPAGEESSDPRDLDLLARIAALQHRYDRARRLWEMALERSPGDAAHARSIECVEEAEAARTKGRVAAMTAVALLTALVAVFAYRTFHRERSGLESEHAPPRSSLVDASRPPSTPPESSEASPARESQPPAENK